MLYPKLAERKTLRRLCRDTSLLTEVWQTFDSGKDSSIYGDLVSAVRRIISEKPALLGTNEAMQGHGSSHIPGDHYARQGGYLDMGLSAVSSAATAGVSTVSAMIGTEDEGKLDANCNIKVQWSVVASIHPLSGRQLTLPWSSD